MKRLYSYTMISLISVCHWLSAEVLSLEDFHSHAEDSDWGSVDHETSFRSPWESSQFTVRQTIGGYYGPYGRAGNSNSARRLSRPIPVNQAGVIWGTLEYEVQTNGANVSSVSKFTIGQGNLGLNVSIMGMASARTDLEAPISSTVWALGNSAKPSQVIHTNLDARTMTRILWKLSIDPDGNEKIEVWFAPNNINSESALGEADLMRTDFNWLHPIQQIRFDNNGQSRFRMDNLFIATELDEIADALAEL